jgi:ABC-type amino acid transport substrate-binding protein
MIPRNVVLLAFATLTLALPAFPGVSRDRSVRLARSLADVRAAGKLVMLCYPNQESAFIRVNVEVGFGHYDGIDYELMEGFAKSLGVALEVRPVKPTSDDLIPELLAGKGDVIASSFGISRDRKKRVDFSTPYFMVKRAVVARKGRPFYSSVDLVGKHGSTVKGSSTHERMKQLTGIKFHFEDYPRWTLDAVNTGETDFTVIDASALRHLLPLYPELEVAFELSEEVYFGFAVAPESELREALDLYIDKIEESGQLGEIVQRYLNPPAP